MFSLSFKGFSRNRFVANVCRASTSSRPRPRLPASASVVVVGGGAIGTSTLYHLTKLGVRDVILLERNELTSGTTHHSAGLHWRLRPNDVDVQLLARTRELVATGELERESGGLSTGWIQSGGLFIASNNERLNEYKRLMTLGKHFGIESYVLSPTETDDLYPLLKTSDVCGTLFSPGDGSIDPSSLTNSLARAAVRKGAKVFEHCPVTGVNVGEDDLGIKRVTGIKTEFGDISTPCVVNCCGVWASKLGAMAGVAVPLLAMHHAYVVTQKIDGVKGKPNVRDHDASVYLRVQGEALFVGGYENSPKFWDNVQDDFAFSLFDLDWNVFEQNINGAINRLPTIGKTPVQSTVCGPESFTADHKPLMGESPEVRGFYLNCGYNSAGIMNSGGCGEQMAEWIVHGTPSLDMFGYDIRRFHSSVKKDRTWLKETSHEAYAKNYSVVFPKDQPLAGRRMRKDPFYEILLDAGCVYQEKHGWERPGWFADPSLTKGRSTEVKPYDYYGSYGNDSNDDYAYRDLLEKDYTFDFPLCHDQIGRESLACRERAAVFNMSSFGKFFLIGPDAERAADWLCTNNVRKSPGSSIYTCMLNERGGVESDLVYHVLSSSLSSDELQPQFEGKGFYITSPGISGEHDYNHIKRVIEECQYDCKLLDYSDKFGVLSVQGPKSIDILQQLTSTSLLNADFPFGSHQPIFVAGHLVRAVRLTFVGELGWELHVPFSSCVSVYEAIMKVGNKYGIVNAGYRALDSLSIEKGYRHWHEDLRSDDNPLEAGLGFVCKLKTDIPFLGREVLENLNGLRKRLCCFTLDDHVALHGLEVIWRNGVCVGYLRRSDYAYYLEKSVGFGYVRNPESSEAVSNEFLSSGQYQIESMGNLHPATIHLKAPFDAANKRIKGKYDSAAR